MSTLRTQVHVSSDTGEVAELYVWEDSEFLWQGGFAKSDTGWFAILETKNDTGFKDLGHFDTLALALEAYRQSGRACPSFILNNSDKGVYLENFIIG